jgi:hypothetical protein
LNSLLVKEASETWRVSVNETNLGVGASGKELQQSGRRVVGFGEPSCIATKRMASENKGSRRAHMKRRQPHVAFVLCVQNEGCDDLEIRKLYQVLPDQAAAQVGYLRVIDESGEDYLYPAEYFVAVELPNGVAKALALSA